MKINVKYVKLSGNDEYNKYTLRKRVQNLSLLIGYLLISSIAYYVTTFVPLSTLLFNVEVSRFLWMYKTGPKPLESKPATFSQKKSNG